MKHSTLYIASLLLGGAGAWFILHWGSNFGLLDKANERSSHNGVIPKGGGIGILAAFILASYLLKIPLLIWGSITIASISSFYGDKKEVPPKIRLLIQLISGICLLIGLFHLGERSFWVYLLIPFFSLYVVGTANYYNFMDGINGIAAITGIVAFSLIILFTLITKTNMTLLPLAGCMAFACIGFLPFNLPNARVFMGDVGSILLGFVYASFVVVLSRNLSDFLVLCAFLFPFYADELSTMFIRLKNKDNLMQPHRKHVYQLLANEMGLPHWKISIAYGLLQLAIGISVIIIKPMGLVFLISILSIYFVGFFLYSILIRHRIKTL